MLEFPGLEGDNLGKAYITLISGDLTYAGHCKTYSSVTRLRENIVKCYD